MASSSESSSNSSPNVTNESKGSSVSTTFREEYEDLLRYAVVTPKFDGKIKGVLIKSTQQSGQAPPSVPPPSNGEQVSHLVINDESGEEEQEEDTPITPIVPPPFNDRPHFPSEFPPQSNHTHQHTDHTHHHINHTHSHDHTHPPVSDSAELGRLERQLDHWCNDLKRNVLAEFEQSLIMSREKHRTEMSHEIDRLKSQHELLQSQLERTKALLTTYEQSVNRKDQIIQSLTKSLQKQKDRIGLARSFATWRARHNDDKREAFVSVIAERHYCRQLKYKVFIVWFGIIQERWRNRVKKACQLRAEEVCHQLKANHDNEMTKLRISLEEKEQLIQQLCRERDTLGDNMKKAFMRGVCALNMETMSMFNNNMQPVGYHDDDEAPPTPPIILQEEERGGTDRERGGGRKEPKIRIERHH